MMRLTCPFQPDDDDLGMGLDDLVGDDVE
ncbi:hypothetical protein Tco_0718083, partial [Tanacetum coccineum]